MSPSRSRGRPRIHDHDRVVALYAEGLTPAAIAREMNISRETVGTILRRAGVTKSRPAYRAEMEAEREEKARLKEAARQARKPVRTFSKPSRMPTTTQPVQPWERPRLTSADPFD